MIVLFNDSPSVPTRSIGVYRIATVLRNIGLEVEVIDYLSHWKMPELLSYLNKIKDIDWFGFSCKFFRPGEAPKYYLIKDHVKNKDKGIFTQLSPQNENTLLDYIIKHRKKPVILGGPNTELVRHLTDKFDVITLGYADSAILAIHHHLTSGADLKYELYNNTKIVDCDVDYPVTDLSNLETYFIDNDFLEEDEVFPIEISRGCIFSCAFCEFAHIGKKPGTYIRDKESIKKDIVYRYNKFKSKRFLFVDDTFNDSIEKMKMIKEIREETNIPFEFWSYSRLDLLQANPEQVDLIPDIGWKAFTFGVETFNRDSGKKVGKGADPEKLKKFLLALRERFPDIRIQINIIVGLPHETEETLKETVDWFVKNNHLTQNVKLQTLAIRNPTGKKFNSKMAKDPGKYGYKVIGISLHDLVWQTEHMSRDQAKKLVDKYQEILVQNLSSKFKHRNTIVSMTDEPQVVITPSGTVVNLHINRVDRYINKKLAIYNLSRI